MKFNALMLNHLIGKSNIILDDRKYLVAMALAKNVGYKLTLPSSAVESHSKWFADNHQSAVETLLAEINELSVINIQECYELTFKVWKMRYMLVFDCNALDITRILDCQFENDSKQIPEIYRTVYCRLGAETVNRFTQEVGYALTVEQAV